MTQFFIDRAGTLSNVRRTAVGGMLVDATLAKAGVMDYWTDPKSNPDKLIVKRHNPAAVLAASAADVATAPVTFNHPKKFVDIHNYQALAAGHVVGTPTFEDGHIKATLAINDAQLMRAIELGAAREVSMGYAAYHDGIPGVTESGEAYDESRIKIEWNHIAIVPAGRAGKSVRLMLDSAEIPQEDEEIVTIKINGVEVKADNAQAAFDAHEAGLIGKLSTAEAKAVKLQTQVDELTAKLAEATSDAALDARVKDRDEKLAVQKAADEKLARVKAAFPAVDLAGRSQDFVDGLFATLPPAESEPAPVKDELAGALKPTIKTKAEVKDQAGKKPVSSSDAYEAMRAADRAASMAPVGTDPLKK